MAVKSSQRPLAVGAVLTVGALVAAGVTAATASATPTPPASPATPSALAAQKTAELVANPPAYLMASANDRFQQGGVVSSGAAQYVPFERTYAGLSVRGGDFVLVTNNAGQVIYSSVAMQHPIGALSTSPSVTRAAAEAAATKQLRAVSKVEG